MTTSIELFHELISNIFSDFSYETDLSTLQEEDLKDFIKAYEKLNEIKKLSKKKTEKVKRQVVDEFQRRGITELSNVKLIESSGKNLNKTKVLEFLENQFPDETEDQLKDRIETLYKQYTYNRILFS